MSTDSKLYAIPIAKRHSLAWSAIINAVLFCLLFNVSCIINNTCQFLFLMPLKLLPFAWARQLYAKGMRYTKGAFACLMILMCQWFAPSKLMITFETEGKGKFTAEEIDKYIVKEQDGHIIGLDLPTKFVLIANHQIYADWWYTWCFTYFMSAKSVHQNVYITLKKSLRWVPIVGWGMQFFNFIFLARSWASDRLQLAKSLASLGETAEQDDTSFCFMLYPEGTLVSEKTRPISKKFADKTGIPDLENMLLPRSTGLHYTLRSLAPRIPELKLLDLTVVYPGIPPQAYGQDYYTLRSIFLNGHPPPEIRIHLRLFDVHEQVPIGDLSATKDQTKRTKKCAVEVDIPGDEKDTFESWLRALWREKDHSISQFHDSGGFNKTTDKEPPVVEMPLRLRHKSEVMRAFGFAPLGAAYWVMKRR